MAKRNSSRKLTVVDIFSGVGGLSLGFVQEGFDLLFANDCDPDAASTFRHNHPGVKFHEGDIKDLDKKMIKSFIGSREVDVLVGGVPCQSFSMKGKRILSGSGEDPRDYLFREFMRVAEIIRPDVAVIENVKGIISARSGKIRNEIVKDFHEMGYSVDYRVLNAADYGVPQVRERTVFIANRIKKKNVFPKATHSQGSYVGVRAVFDDVPTHNHEPKELSGKVLERVRLISPGENWRSLPKELQTGSTHSGAYGRLHPEKPAMTLTTRFDTPPGGYVTHPTEDRAITVREGARIQTFPDDFVFIGNRMSQYRQVGNAVPVKMSRALARGIKEMLS